MNLPKNPWVSVGERKENIGVEKVGNNFLYVWNQFPLITN